MRSPALGAQRGESGYADRILSAATADQGRRSQSEKLTKLRSLPFETAIINRYKRRESSVEEALVEMYLAGVSVRRVEDITEALWGKRVSP